MDTANPARVTPSRRRMSASSAARAALPVTLYIALLGALCSPLRAQPEYQISRILFEAHPVPETELPALAAAAESGRALTSVTNGAVHTAAAPYSRFSFIDASNELVDTDSPADRATAEAAIAAYRNSIVDTVGDEGPFSSGLFEQLLSLSQAYQQMDKHDEALEALEKAEYISRINNGLYTPTQFTVVEQMVESLMASGEMQEAMTKQQYLLYLHTQYYGPSSKQLVPALERLGDWSMQAFETGVHGSKSVGFVLAGRSGFNGPLSNRKPVLSPRAQSISNLGLAQRRYYQAIVNLLDSDDFHNAQILELEEKLLQSIYYEGHRIGLMKDPDFYLDARIESTGSRISHAEFQSNMMAFVNGKNALLRTLIYLESNARADAKARVVTLLNLGDWHSLFNRLLEADDFYERAHALARSIPERQDEWQVLLNPPVPRQLPDFIALPHSRATFGIADDAAVEFDGYIDVKLALSRSGNVRSIKVLGSTDNVSSKLTKRLRRLVRSAPFRPMLEDGVPVASEKLVRYYFAHMQKETGI